MALRAEHVGQRVVVRRRLPGERGPSGGPALTDVLGVLDALTDESLVVRRDDGDMVTVGLSDVVAAKPVPPRASVRHRISAEDLQLICAAGWQAPVQERLGGWLLRAGDGFTGRANSVLPVGDPGVPPDAALQRVSDFYRAHGLPAQAQVIVGSSIMDLLHARGWLRSRPDEADALVQIASVAIASRTRPAHGGSDDIRLHDTVTRDWLEHYGRSAGAPEGTVRSVLSSGDQVAFASLGEPAAAIGRAVVTGDWLGLSAVEVDPALRGQGLGATIVAALLGWGASRGARSAYVQTLADNDAALALFARYGFSTHHSYRYLRPPH